MDANHAPLFQSSASRCHVASALTAEALAMKKALEEAVLIGKKELNMFSDSQVLISLTNSGKSTIKLKRLLYNISLLSLSFEAISFLSTPRSNNDIADS